MIAPLVKTIEVPCSQEKAFQVFINEMDSWWPLGKFTVSAMGGQAAQAIRVEAQSGGSIVEVGSDGTEHLWGTIKSYDPYGFLSMDFHIPRPGEKVKDRTLVEIEFMNLGNNLTRVTLTQSNWEALGKLGAPLRGGYDGGWDAIFVSAYNTACGG